MVLLNNLQRRDRCHNVIIQSDRGIRPDDVTATARQSAAGKRCQILPR
jgi:hypothetical protein